MAKRRRFIAPDQLERAAREVSKIARSQVVPSAVVGGFAMQLYGSDRMTADLDVVATSKLRGARSKSDITFGGETLRGPFGVPVDWIVRSDEYASLYEEAIAEARNTGRGYRVVSPEHLAAMKLAARRPKDHEDLVFLLRQPRLVKLTKARDVIRRLLGGRFAVDEFDSVVMEARWRRKVEKGGKS